MRTQAGLVILARVVARVRTKRILGAHNVHCDRKSGYCSGRCPIVAQGNISLSLQTSQPKYLCGSLLCTWVAGCNHVRISNLSGDDIRAHTICGNLHNESGK